MAQVTKEKTKPAATEPRKIGSLAGSLAQRSEAKRSEAMPRLRELAQRMAGGGLPDNEVAEVEKLLQSAGMTPAEFDSLAGLYGQITSLEKQASEANRIGADLTAARREIEEKRSAIKAAEKMVEDATHAWRHANANIGNLTRALDRAQQAAGELAALKINHADILGDDGITLPDSLDEYDVLVPPTGTMPEDANVKAVRVDSATFERESERRRRIMEHAVRDARRDAADRHGEWRRRQTGGNDPGPEPEAFIEGSLRWSDLTKEGIAVYSRRK